jgi:hypothetical protein
MIGSMVVFAYCLALYIELWIVGMRGCELRLISFRPVVVHASGEVPALIGRVALRGRREAQLVEQVLSLQAFLLVLDLEFFDVPSLCHHVMALDRSDLAGRASCLKAAKGIWMTVKGRQTG